MLEEGRINSQNELAREVLRSIGSEFALSPKRARLIAAGSDRIKIRVFTRRSEERMKECPFCGRPLVEERGVDVYGRPTVGGRACEECEFRIDPGRRGPARYTFDLR